MCISLSFTCSLIESPGNSSQQRLHPNKDRSREERTMGEQRAALKASAKRRHRTSAHRLLAKASHMTEPDSNRVRMNNPSTEKDMEGEEGRKRDSRERGYM